jgi:phosphate acetyltransferase
MPDLAVDGELQADAALLQKVADSKAPGSNVAGKANVLIFPDLNAGNIGYKLTNVSAARPPSARSFQGLDKPCNDLSRGCKAEDIVDAGCDHCGSVAGEEGWVNPSQQTEN